MTTLQQIELRCPICDTRFKSQQVISTNSFGGKRTDFHERAAGTQPLPFLIHMCSRCGYSGAERDFTEETDVSAGLREHVWNELAPQISTGAVLGSEKYEAAAKVAEWQALDARHIADLLLRAAWCCVDESDTEAERFFRRKAAWKFEEALSSFDGVAREERAVLTYLVGELWRRVGDMAQATTWFNRVPAEITDLSSQQWVLDAPANSVTARGSGSADHRRIAPLDSSLSEQGASPRAMHPPRIQGECGTSMWRREVRRCVEHRLYVATSYRVPKRRSPASPRPGRIYPCGLS